MISISPFSSISKQLDQSQTVGQNEATQQQKIIRVGSFEDTFDYVDENGLRRGYGYELLQTLAGYTGWKFEYAKNWFYYTVNYSATSYQSI